MSDGVCDHCAEWSRHPCTSEAEAKECANAPAFVRDAILLETMSAQDVADYLLAFNVPSDEKDILTKAAEIVRARG